MGHGGGTPGMGLSDPCLNSELDDNYMTEYSRLLKTFGNFQRQQQ
jgi:hypothetical protein